MLLKKKKMKVKIINAVSDRLRAESLLDIKGGISDELQDNLEGCSKCNCCFGNENKQKGRKNDSKSNEPLH